MLVVLSGLPGVGKSTLARELARQTGAAWLRIDEIEQAIKTAGLDPGPAGYLVGYALARSNLEVGRSVIADCCNPIELTRAAWREAAGSNRIVEVEVVCSDEAAHRERVETRTAEVPGLRLPAWRDVPMQRYDAWARDRLIVDTMLTVDECIAAIRRRMGGDGIEPPANSV